MALEGRGSWLPALAIPVVAWRVAALFYPHAQMTESPALRAALMMLGLWHLACGLWAFRTAPGRASFLFALYGLAMGLHWGGPLAPGGESLDLLLLGFYFAVSSIAAQALFLHLALAFPPAARVRRLLPLLYLPAVVGILLLIPLFVPGASDGARNLLAAGLNWLLPLATLLAVGGAVVWVVRLFRSADRVAPAVVVAAIVVDVVTQGLSAAGITLEGWLQLAYAAVPTALAWALTRTPPQDRLVAQGDAPAGGELHRHGLSRR